MSKVRMNELILTSNESCISHVVSSGCNLTVAVPISASDRKNPLKQHNRFVLHGIRWLRGQHLMSMIFDLMSFVIVNEWECDDWFCLDQYQFVFSIFKYTYDFHQFEQSIKKSYFFWIETNFDGANSIYSIAKISKISPCRFCAVGIVIAWLSLLLCILNLKLNKNPTRKSILTSCKWGITIFFFFEKLGLRINATKRPKNQPNHLHWTRMRRTLNVFPIHQVPDGIMIA